MEELMFTKEEKKEIRETLNVVLDDLEELWKIANIDEVNCYYDYGDFHFYSGTRSFKITKTGMRIRVDSEKNIFLEKFLPFPTKLKIKNKDYGEIFEFLRNYERIRSSIERDIRLNSERKNEGLAALKSLKEKYQKEATIELELPPANNLTTFDVHKEDGKTIGEVRMGAVVLRIITKGSIVLLNESVETKQQVKVKKI